MDNWEHVNWLHSNEHGTQWRSTWPSSFLGMQLPSNRHQGRACHLRQREEQRHHAGRVHTLLSGQDGGHFWCKAPTNKVSLGLYYMFAVLNSLTHHLYRCLTHIINLSTQAVISTYSKSGYYDGNMENNHFPEDSGTGEHDEIGIICAICIKVCSNSFLLFHLLPWTYKGTLLSTA